jgi:hypothetical protein
MMGGKTNFIGGVIVAMIGFFSLFLPACRVDKWKNLTAQDRIDIEQGCKILDPLEFKAKIKRIDWYDHHGKRRPKRIIAVVFSYRESPFLEKAKNFRPQRWFDFREWPEIKLLGEDVLVTTFPPGDTLIKESGACAFSNNKNKTKHISLYLPYRE